MTDRHTDPELSRMLQALILRVVSRDPQALPACLAFVEAIRSVPELAKEADAMRALEETSGRDDPAAGDRSAEPTPRRPDNPGEAGTIPTREKQGGLDSAIATAEVRGYERGKAEGIADRAPLAEVYVWGLAAAEARGDRMGRIAALRNVWPQTEIKLEENDGEGGFILRIHGRAIDCFASKQIAVWTGEAIRDALGAEADRLEAEWMKEDNK